MELCSLHCLLILILLSSRLENRVLVYGDSRPTYCDKEERCGPNGPPIRFPLGLKEKNCSVAGFVLYCSGNDTALDLPLSQSVKPLLVSKIDYKSREIRVRSKSNCLPKLLISELNGRAANSSFQFGFGGEKKSSYTLLKCPMRSQPCRTLMVRSDSEVRLSRTDVVSCTKIDEFEAVPDEVYQILLEGYSGSEIPLRWSSTPDCESCEARGQGCRLKKNGSKPGETECFVTKDAKWKVSKQMRIISIAAACSIFIIVTILVCIYFYTRKKYNKNDSQSLEKFIEDYTALKPSRYSYKDIKKITNEFGEMLGEGAFATVFKGKLSNDILVAVKMLNNTKGNGEDFINEVKTMNHVHHVNVVRLAGFCADGCRRALVYDFLPNGTLERHVSPDSSLGWETLNNIVIGVAKGIDYLHQGCDNRISYFDVKPWNILLDQNFVPKISDFGLAKLCSKDPSAVAMNIEKRTIGYIAPEVLSRNFGSISYKSDVYSFGMLLLEIVGKRKNTNVIDDGSAEIHYPEWIYNLLEEGDDFRILIEGDENAEIIKKLAIVGLCCIQWNPINRPTMRTVVQMLEEESELTIPPNPFSSLRGPRENTGSPATRTAFELEAIAQ